MYKILKQLFSRRSEQQKPQSGSRQLNILNRYQHRFAYVLSRHEKKLNNKQKKMILLIYCFCFGSFFAALLFKPLYHHSSKELLKQHIPLLPLDTTNLSPLNKHQKQDTIIINAF